MSIKGQKDPVLTRLRKAEALREQWRNGRRRKGWRLSPATRERMSQAQKNVWADTRKGWRHSQATKTKISRTANGWPQLPMKRARIWSVEVKQKITDGQRASWASGQRKTRPTTEEQRLMIGIRNARLTRRQKQSASLKRRWADPVHKDRVVTATLQAQRQQGNGLERRVLAALIDAFPNAGWRFNPGVITAGGKVADLICTDGRLAVDAFGDYWHRDETPASIRARQRHFAARGVRLVIIWESAFKKNPNLVVRRVRAAVRRLEPTL